MRASHGLSQLGVFLGLPLAVLVLFIVPSAGTSPEPQDVGSTSVGPDRTFEIPGVSVTLEEMERFDAALVERQPWVIPFLSVPGPLPLPGSEQSIQDAAPQESAPGSERSLQEPPGLPTVLEEAQDIEPSPAPEPAAPPLLSNFAGMLDNNTSIPPDTHGAAGPSHLVSILNRGFAIFNKSTGAIISGPISLQAFWAALGTGDNDPAREPFDPKVLYDQYSARFIVVSDGGVSRPPRPPLPSWVLVAISNSSDPTMGFTLFAIDADVTSPGQWADYPGLGVDSIAVYVTNNMFDRASPPAFQGTKYWVVNKASLLSGGPLVVSEFTRPNTFGGTWQPTHAFGPTSATYLIDEGWFLAGPPQRNFVRIQDFTFPSGSPVLTDRGFIEVASYGFNVAGAPQPGCSQTIDTGSTRLLNAVLRNGRLWTTHNVDDLADATAGKTVVAWYEINPGLANGSGTNGPVQQGRVGDPSRWYYYPSIAVNADGCAALGFSGSDASTFASGYYTSRKPTDPAGTMEPVGLLKAGVASYYKDFGAGSNRWGDYSATSIDPVDDRTFWTIQEYAETQVGGACPTVDTGRWGTWWGRFRCQAGCTTNVECSDGLFCNGAETCDLGSGTCVAGTPPNCNDSNPCTLDACDEATDLCTHVRSKTLLGTDGSGGNLYRIDTATGASS
ncbi:MAG: hypothetical protein HY510_08615, partial [Acidobacteria bacterium]|nr:hypothetical protein [Acidobacteriota bacterium]